MLISEKTKKATSAVFISAEVIFTVLVQFVGGRANDVISFISVLLACAFAVLFLEKSTKYVLTQAALVFTVLADFFLVIVEPPARLLAMLFFIAVQISYCIRIIIENKAPRVNKIHIILRFAISALSVLLAFFVLGEKADALALVSVLYFANLLLNVAFAFVGFKSSPHLPIGLLLFAFCDIFVGLSMIDSYLQISEGTLIYALANPGFNAAWLFYIPAQTFLALSLKKQATR